MKRFFLFCLFVLSCSSYAAGTQDNREKVEFPDVMQTHMLANMRDHLVALDEILMHLGMQTYDQAAEIAENRLGMSSLALHGADHMAPFMPTGMQQAGTAMHKAASYFAVVAQEGDALHAYSALREITAACVVCHAGYRIR